MGHCEVTPRSNRIAKSRKHGLVLRQQEEVHQRHHHDTNRPPEIYQAGRFRVLQNRLRLQRRREDDAYALLLTLRRDDPARLPDRDVVDVDVHDSGRGAQALRDVVRVACGGQPGADVDGLRDALLHYLAHRAPQEGAVFDGHGLNFWEGGFDGEVMRPA